MINQAALDLIKQFEGFRSEPYQDSGGVWSIGYGHTSGVTQDTSPIAEADAEELLRDDLTNAENDVDDLVSVPLNHNQYGALVSLVYNVGTGPLKGHLGEYLNAEKYDQAADAFLQWDHINGVVSPGLTRRRTAERQLFLTTGDEA